MYDPLTLANAFTTIVGLLAEFKAGREGATEDEYSKFLEWLVTQQHIAIATTINENHLLEAGIQNLLSEDHHEAQEKLNSICLSVVELGRKLGTFDEFITEVGVNENDRYLYRKFIETLPVDSGAIPWLKNHDFASPYRTESTRPIYGFSETWCKAEYKFIDPNLEEAKENLRQSCSEYCSTESMWRKTTHGAEFLTIIPDQYHNSDSWPDWVVERIKVLDDLGMAVHVEHRNFDALCRKILQL